MSSSTYIPALYLSLPSVRQTALLITVEHPFPLEKIHSPEYKAGEETVNPWACSGAGVTMVTVFCGVGLIVGIRDYHKVSKVSLKLSNIGFLGYLFDKPSRRDR